MGIECKCMYVITIFQNAKWVVVLYIALIVSGQISQTLICKTWLQTYSNNMIST